MTNSNPRRLFNREISGLRALEDLDHLPGERADRDNAAPAALLLALAEEPIEVARCVRASWARNVRRDSGRRDRGNLFRDPNLVEPDWEVGPVNQSKIPHNGDRAQPKASVDTSNPAKRGRRKPGHRGGRSSECVVARSLRREQVAVSGDTTTAPTAGIVPL
jgi:hypothetical protein